MTRQPRPPEEILTTRLKSGLLIATERDPMLRTAGITVWVRVGSAQEAGGEAGIAHFIEHMLFKGSRRRSALSLAQKMDELGSTTNAMTGKEFTAFYAHVLGEHTEKALELLLQIIAEPTFPQDELDREKKVILEEIRSHEDSPDSLVHDLFLEKVWDGHPLGRHILGTEDSVKRFNRRSLLAFYRRYYRPDRMMITAAGDVDHDRVVALASRALGGGASDGDGERATSVRFHRGLHVVEKKTEQVHLCLGVPTCHSTHPRRYAVAVLDTLVGGGMSSRLFQTVREKRGLAYSIYSYTQQYRRAGAFAVYCGTGKATFRKTVGCVLNELRRVRERGVGKEEIKRAKSQLKSGLMLGLESAMSRAFKMGRDFLHFDRYVPLDEILETCDAVSAGDVAHVSAAFVRENLALVAVGELQARAEQAALRDMVEACL